MFSGIFASKQTKPPPGIFHLDKNVFIYFSHIYIISLLIYTTHTHIKCAETFTLVRWSLISIVVKACVCMVRVRFDEDTEKMFYMRHSHTQILISASFHMHMRQILKILAPHHPHAPHKSSLHMCAYFSAYDFGNLNPNLDKLLNSRKVMYTTTRARSLPEMFWWSGCYNRSFFYMHTYTFKMRKYL